MKRLQLTILQAGVSLGLSSARGGALAEAASVCLAQHSHPIEVPLMIDGAITDYYTLARLEVDQRGSNSWGDKDEATEDGAMGLALAFIHDQTGYKAVRSYKGTGIDFWLGESDESGFPFQNKARLEISGDFEGQNSALRQRLRQKERQTEISDHMNLPAYIVVVEFSTPKLLTARR
jgi:hypothetical protein